MPLPKKLKRILSLTGRFVLGALIGLTTLAATALLLALFTIYKRIDYGPVLALGIGCSVSGFFYLLTLWGYRDDDPPQRSDEETS